MSIIQEIEFIKEPINRLLSFLFKHSDEFLKFVYGKHTEFELITASFSYKHLHFVFVEPNGQMISDVLSLEKLREFIKNVENDNA